MKVVLDIETVQAPREEWARIAGRQLTSDEATFEETGGDYLLIDEAHAMPAESLEELLEALRALGPSWEAELQTRQSRCDALRQDVLRRREEARQHLTQLETLAVERQFVADRLQEPTLAPEAAAIDDITEGRAIGAQSFEVHALACR